jgi:hypothetical protein
MQIQATVRCHFTPTRLAGLLQSWMATSLGSRIGDRARGIVVDCSPHWGGSTLKS